MKRKRSSVHLLEKLYSEKSGYFVNIVYIFIL